MLVNGMKGSVFCTAFEQQVATHPCANPLELTDTSKSYRTTNKFPDKIYLCIFYTILRYKNNAL